MNIPENLKYTKDHEWIKVDGDTATVGVTDFAQQQLGDVVFVEIETEGDSLNKGDVFGTIEAVKTVSDMYMPVSGEIIEVNPKLEDAPETVNEDPYGEGWMIKVKMENADEANELMAAEDYKKEVE
jgi:glycine cleavage system H protein